MMPLLSTRLVILLAVLAVLLFGFLVIGPRRRVSARRGVLTRGLQVIALNVVVLGLAGVLLNQQYVFYVSWSDLLGTGSTTASTVTEGNAREGGKIKLDGGLAAQAANLQLPPLPYPNQQEQAYNVTGPKSGTSGTVLVWLPKGYDPEAAKAYPVIVALSGYPGVPRSSLQAFQFSTTFDQLVGQGVITAPIVVMPQINDPANLDTECVDAPNHSGPQAETWLSQDIPNWITSHFRVRTDRTSWAVMGYSYGGWCSAVLSMRHPQIFGASMVLMGYFRPEFSPGYDPLPANSAAAEQYDLITMARKHPPAVSMWVMAAKTDPSAYPQSVAFLKAVRSPTSVTAYLTTTGGHRTDTIPPAMPAMLRWLHNTLPGFAN